MDEDEFYSNQWDKEEAAAAGFPFDLDAPFESVDAYPFYLEYAVRLDKCGNIGANESRELFAILCRARRSLQGHELRISPCLTQCAERPALGIPTLRTCHF